MKHPASQPASQTNCTIENARFGFSVCLCSLPLSLFHTNIHTFSFWYFPSYQGSCRIISFVWVGKRCVVGFVYTTQYISPILETTAVRLTYTQAKWNIQKHHTHKWTRTCDCKWYTRSFTHSQSKSHTQFLNNMWLRVCVYTHTYMCMLCTNTNKQSRATE